MTDYDESDRRDALREAREEATARANKQFTDSFLTDMDAKNLKDVFEEFLEAKKLQPEFEAWIVKEYKL